MPPFRLRMIAPELVLPNLMVLVIAGLMILLALPQSRAAVVPFQATPVKVTPAKALAVAPVALIRTPLRGTQHEEPALSRRERANAEVAEMAKKGELHCLATAVYFEARGESLKGQRAVAEVVLARVKVKGRPKSVCGVVYEGSWRRSGCQFSFTCDGRSDVARSKKAWSRAKQIAAAALESGGKKRLVRGATFYHASYVRPGWSKRMVKVAQIGTHIFYRPRKGRLL